jgi:peptidoglycan/LPS O-acetylase OafA/YrhL
MQSTAKAYVPRAVPLATSRPARFSPTLVAETGQKILVLESVRGIAALAVFNYHFIDLFARQIWTAPFGVMFSSALGTTLALAQTTPLNVFVNSELAVRTFFVLSGFVLSWRFCNHGGDDIPRNAALKRGIRLAVPIWASLLVAFVVLRVFSAHAALLQMEPVFDTTMLRQDAAYPPTWWEVIRQSVKVLFFGTDFKTMNRSLWTMQHEFLGSYVVFCFLILFGVVKHRWILYLGGAVIALLTSHPYVVDFLIGMGLCDLTASLRSNVRALQLFRFWSLPCVALGVGYMMLWYPLVSHGWPGVDLYRVAPAVASGLMVFGILYSPAIQRLLRFKALVFFGKISFGTYLLHLPVIYAIGGWTFVWVYGYSGSYALTFVASYVVSLIVLLAVAELFTRYVDRPSISLSHRFATTLTAAKP